MHEYEFRIVVQDPEPFLPLVQSLGLPVRQQIVYYLKPHFRFRHGTFETKRVESTHAVYHDGLWFRWVHSVETPYRAWSKATYSTFLHNIGNYQDPLTVETRHVVTIDAHAQIYCFQSTIDSYRLVFEWEHGTFHRPQNPDPARLLASLDAYKRFYDLFKRHASPPFKLSEQMVRKPVSTVDALPEGEQYLYAHKLDGVFGLVYSYRDKIKEKWEGYECKVRRNQSLGDGLVFAAERMEGGEVYLLDVYQVQGHDTIKWCRRDVLLHFLPGLSLVEGYFVQKYVSIAGELEESNLKTDGFIAHDVWEDVIFKVKTHHTIDLVYERGYFRLPNGRIKCLEEGLEDGCVYEISIEDGRVVRRRFDRFKGNTAAQVESVLKHGWRGPRIEPLTGPLKGKKK